MTCRARAYHHSMVGQGYYDMYKQLNYTSDIDNLAVYKTAMSSFGLVIAVCMLIKANAYLF